MESISAHLLMEKCLVLCKTLDVLTEFLGQNRGQMGKSWTRPDVLHSVLRVISIAKTLLLLTLITKSGFESLTTYLLSLYKPLWAFGALLHKLC